MTNFDEIKEDDFNLNIPRYVDTFGEEEIILLSAVVQELQEVKAYTDKSIRNLFELVGSLTGTST